MHERAALSRGFKSAAELDVKVIDGAVTRVDLHSLIASVLVVGLAVWGAVYAEGGCCFLVLRLLRIRCGVDVSGSDKRVAKSESEVIKRIALFSSKPDFPRLSGHHRLPFNSLICSGEVWRSAVLRLVKNAGLVVFDIRNVSVDNAGVMYELTIAEPCYASFYAYLRFAA